MENIYLISIIEQGTHHRGLQIIVEQNQLAKGRGSKGSPLDFSVILEQLSFVAKRICLLFIKWLCQRNLDKSENWPILVLGNGLYESNLLPQKMFWPSLCLSRHIHCGAMAIF